MKGHEEILWDNKYDYHPDFWYIQMSKLVKWNTLNTFSVLYVNFMSVKLIQDTSTGENLKRSCEVERSTTILIKG